MDDLHDHDLIRTPFSFAGVDCFVERSDAARADAVFHGLAVEATAFAQLAKGVAVGVFGLDPSVVHVYYHWRGATAAFNRGGSLFFNLDTFLSQLEARAWRTTTVLGPDRQPRFLLPPDAIVEWFGVFCHELAHNHVMQHDAAFSNWMLMLFTEFLDKLQAYLDRCEAGRRAGVLAD
jgi:hypothetical protein